MNGWVCTKSRVNIVPKVTSGKLASPLTSGLGNISLLCVGMTVEMPLRIFQTHHMKHDWENARFIYNEDDWYRRLVLESSYMAIYSNFNNMRSILGIDQFSVRLILKSHPELDAAPP